jgi:hypothetical protein
MKEKEEEKVRRWHGIPNEQNGGEDRSWAREGFILGEYTPIGLSTMVSLLLLHLLLLLLQPCLVTNFTFSLQMPLSFSTTGEVCLS